MGIFKRRSLRRQRKRLVKSYRSFFICIILLNLTNILYGINFAVTSEIIPNPVGKNDKFTLTLFVDYPDALAVNIIEPEIPPVIHLVGGPYIRPFIDKSVEGDSKKIVKIVYTFRARKTGWHKLGGFTVLINGQSCITEPVLIGVGLYKNRKLYIPLEASWNLSQEKIYKGESVLLLLEVRNREKIILFDSITVTPPNSVFFEKISGFGEIRMETIGSKTLYHLPAAAFIFTSSKAGKVFISPAVVSSGGITGKSQTLGIDVLPVPAGVEVSGAVGRFIYKNWVENTNVVEGEEIILHLKIEGEGNFNYLQMPEPVYKNGTLLSKEERCDISPGLHGYYGFREIIYHFIAEVPGNNYIEIPPFPWLDRETDTVYPGKGEKLLIIVGTSSYHETGNDQAADIMRFLPKTVQEIDSEASWGAYTKLINYLWFLPGPVLFFIFIFFKKKKIFIIASLILFISSGSAKDVNLDAVSDASAFYIEEQYQKSLEIYKTVSKDMPECAAVFYNIGIVSYHLGNYGEAVHAVRRAVYLNPLNQLYRDFLKWIESELKLERQIPPVFRIHPDIFFFLLIILVNIGSLAAIYQLYKPKGIYVILLILFFSCSVISCGGLIYTHVKRTEKAGVIITDDVSIKNIPKETSSSVLNLQEGTALYVLESADRWVFVENGYGIKGWIRKDSIILDSKNRD